MLPPLMSSAVCEAELWIKKKILYNQDHTMPYKTPNVSIRVLRFLKYKYKIFTQ